MLKPPFCRAIFPSVSVALGAQPLAQPWRDPIQRHGRPGDDSDTAAQIRFFLPLRRDHGSA